MQASIIVGMEVLVGFRTQGECLPVRFGSWDASKPPLRSMQGAVTGTTVGALRTVYFSDAQSSGQFVEQLSGLDDAEHYM